MLTVQGLLDELGLSLAAGKEAAESPIRWVHISELLDPTPWMSGGELLLTTGIQLREDDAAARVRAACSSTTTSPGSGFGTGFEHDDIPAAIVEEAERLGFPLFEVPYEMPFIAITEKAFARLVNEQYEVLQRGIAVHRRLEQLVLEQRGLQRGRAGAVGRDRRHVVMLDWQGEAMASANFRRELPAGGAGRDPRRGGASATPRAGRRRSSRPTTTSRAARWRCRSQPSRRAGRARGSSRSATRAGWASSSG